MLFSWLSLLLLLLGSSWIELCFLVVDAFFAHRDTPSDTRTYTLTFSLFLSLSLSLSVCLSNKDQHGPADGHSSQSTIRVDDNEGESLVLVGALSSARCVVVLTHPRTLTIVYSFVGSFVPFGSALLGGGHRESVCCPFFPPSRGDKLTQSMRASERAGWNQPNAR